MGKQDDTGKDEVMLPPNLIHIHCKALVLNLKEKRNCARN